MGECVCHTVEMEASLGFTEQREVHLGVLHEGGLLSEQRDPPGKGPSSFSLKAGVQATRTGGGWRGERASPPRTCLRACRAPTPTALQSFCPVPQSQKHSGHSATCSPSPTPTSSRPHPHLPPPLPPRRPSGLGLTPPEPLAENKPLGDPFWRWMSGPRASLGHTQQATQAGCPSQGPPCPHPKLAREGAWAQEGRGGKADPGFWALGPAGPYADGQPPSEAQSLGRS